MNDPLLWLVVGITFAITLTGSAYAIYLFWDDFLKKIFVENKRGK